MTTSMDLANAIRAIPTGSRWCPEKALTTFTHSVLGSLLEVSVTTGAVVVARGFQPLPDGIQWVARKGPIKASTVNAAVAYAEAVGAAPPFEDLLTPVHAQLLGSHGGNGLGQHFTPRDLSNLAAALTEDHLRQQGRASSIHDPCVGAGGLVLAQLQKWRGPLKEVRVVAHDLDPLCVAMCAVQLLANQLIHRTPIGDCVLKVGDSLSGSLKPAFVSMAAAKVHKRAPWEAYDEASVLLRQFRDRPKAGGPGQ